MTIPTLQPVQSSNIAAVGHEGTTLYVQYKGKGEPIWSYAGVEPHVFKELLGCGSIGRYMADFIKPNHKGTRL